MIEVLLCEIPRWIWFTGAAVTFGIWKESYYAGIFTWCALAALTGTL